MNFRKKLGLTIFTATIALIGFNSSDAEAQQNVPPQNVPPLPGDVDGDNVYTMFDANGLARIGNLVVGITDLTGIEHYDVDGDGDVDTEDLKLLISWIEIANVPDNILPKGVFEQGAHVAYCTIGDYVINGKVDIHDYNYWLQYCQDPGCSTYHFVSSGSWAASMIDPAYYTRGDVDGSSEVNEGDHYYMINLMADELLNSTGG